MTQTTVHTVYLDFAGEEPGMLDEEALLTASSVLAERYPELGAACGGGVRASGLGRVGFDVCLSTEGLGGVSALRRALAVADEALSEAGFGVDPDDMAVPGTAEAGGIAPGAKVGPERPLHLIYANVSEESENSEDLEDSENPAAGTDGSGEL